jgi:hypothetical protein
VYSIPLRVLCYVIVPMYERVLLSFIFQAS